jgi:hypothetical protein
MKPNKSKEICHPIDDYKFFIDLCTDTVAGTIEQFSLPFHSLAKEHAADWQKAFLNPSNVFALLPMNWSNPLDKKVSQLQKEGDRQLNQIGHLEAELNKKTTLLKNQEDEISKLKSELSSKKREITLKRNKIETLSMQLTELKNHTKAARTKTHSPKNNKTLQNA